MSKITQYLNEHILGEATSAESVRKRFSRDGSVLSIIPEMVVHPRVTNDIRKVARFTWQLAEKGHIMSMTTRGGGSDQTGAAIGKGVIINTNAHLNKIIYVNIKGKDSFVHVQPGVNFSTLNEMLESNGMFIPSYPTSSDYSTIGGAVANNAGGPLSGRYGLTGDYVTRLEIVLANGDLIETTRINRHELSKKKGLQTFEGELYRKIDGIIEDNQQLISDKISNKDRDNTGYPGIAKVKQRDGSFDLTPLFIGSQGTLGIISEIVLKPEFYNNEELIIVATFNSSQMARDAADLIAQLKPTILDYFDGRTFETAKNSYGKQYLSTDINASAVLFISFNDFSDRARKHQMKLALKKLSKLETTLFTSDNYPPEELYAVREISSLILQPETKKETMPPLIDGASIPANRREEFLASLNDLASKHHIDLPCHINWLGGTVHVRGLFQLNQVSDKQKVFKLISDYTELVIRCDGNMSTESSEGRLRATAAYSQIDDDVLDIYNQIREAFDPFGTLNPGVKQKSDLKTLISHLNPDYDLSDFAQYAPKI
jgi:FAD/FMN-containing dehydrogenase